jgi:hypothetical protein
MNSSRRSLLSAFILCILTALSTNPEVTAQANRSRPKYIRKRTDFVVVCTLFNGPPKGGKVILPDIPITYDPRFVIGARVERVDFGKPPWPVGTFLNFLIHSPTMLFGGAPSGEQFLLTFSPFRPTTPEDKIWFAPETEYLLRAIEKVQTNDEKAEPNTRLHPTAAR